MSRIRLNQEYRNKIANRMRVHLEQENTQEKEKYLKAREEMKPLQDITWKLAEQIVRRHYTHEDVEKAWYLQTKFENVDTIAKDSCFHFGYQGQVESRDENDKPIMVDKYIESHFDFKLDGNINGTESNRQNDFAYAMYRDELKGRENCNPDINIEQEDNQNNPHWTKHTDANSKFIKEVENNFNDNFACDVIGTSYCRSRAIACTKEEFQRMNEFIQMKSNLVKYHQEWQRGIREDMKDIKASLKLIRNLDEGIDLANKTFEAIDIDTRLEESQIIRSNSTGLVLYSPENVASRIAERRKAKLTREEKIALYQQQQSSVVN